MVGLGASSRIAGYFKQIDLQFLSSDFTISTTTLYHVGKEGFKLRLSGHEMIELLAAPLQYKCSNALRLSTKRQAVVHNYCHGFILKPMHSTCWVMQDILDEKVANTEYRH